MRVFSANGVDETITDFLETLPDAYVRLDDVPTAVSGRTMAIDPKTGRLFVIAADTDPAPTAGGRARARTTHLLVLAPTPWGRKPGSRFTETVSCERVAPRLLSV